MASLEIDSTMKMTFTILVMQKKSIKSIIKSTKAILMILVRLNVHRKKRRIKDLEGPNE